MVSRSRYLAPYPRNQDVFSSKLSHPFLEFFSNLNPRRFGRGAETPLTQSDEEEEKRPKQTRKRKRVIAEYELVKRWVTGERAVQPEDDIERELFEEARELMHLSGLKKLPCHKGPDTDLHLWKKASAGNKARTGISYISICCVKVFFSALPTYRFN